MSVRKADNPALFELVQEKNLERQYDLLLNCIEIGLEKGIEAFDKYTLWSLNAAAVANIAQFGGRYREEPIYVGNHIPPHFKDVPDQMDPVLLRHSRELDRDGASDAAAGVCPVADELDPSVCRGEWPNGASRVLLPLVPAAGTPAVREKAGAGTYP